MDGSTLMGLIICRYILFGQISLHFCLSPLVIFVSSKMTTPKEEEVVILLALVISGVRLFLFANKHMQID
jgi:hypothetical protein